MINYTSEPEDGAVHKPVRGTKAWLYPLASINRHFQRSKSYPCFNLCASEHNKKK